MSIADLAQRASLPSTTEGEEHLMAMVFFFQAIVNKFTIYVLSFLDRSW